MMNKKGFTLIELLAVIVILLILVVIVGLGITRIVKKAKTDISASEEKSIIKAAENWVSSNMFSVPDGNCINKSVEELISEGFLDNYDNENIENSSVRICSVALSQQNAYSYTYEIIQSGGN